MPKAFLLTNKRYDLYKLNIPKIWRETGSEAGEGVSSAYGHSITPANTCSRSISWAGQDKDRGGVDDDREWTLVIDEDEPVNLSLKKLDLFNLTQLAEVSLARVNADSKGQQSPAESSTSSSFSLEAEDEREEESQEEGHGEGDKETRRSKGVNEHKNSSPANRHVCVECGRGFSTLSNLARHRQTHRSPTDSTAVKKCPNCDKVYVSMPAFSMHLRTHNQGCKCHFCGKGFSRPWLLQGHIRTHTGEKPFKCNVCAKAFADKSNLRAHVQTHSTEKPFTCSRCQKTFALKSYLCKHIESSCMRSNRSGYTSSSSGKNLSDSEEPPPFTKAA